MAKFNSKFESAKQDWETPQNLFTKLDELYHFNFDLAASSDNTKCISFYSKADDSMTKDWNAASCWLNPPYGNSSKDRLSLWIKKAYEASIRYKNTIVMLIPARTNTSWWHTYCMKAAEIKFICGRPKFGNAKYGLPQPLAIIVFNANSKENTLFNSLYI